MTALRQMTSWAWVTVLALPLFGLAPVAAKAEEPRQAPPARDDQLELPGEGQLHRDFGFPGAIRPWERGMYLRPYPDPHERRIREPYGYYGGAYRIDPYGRPYPYRAHPGTYDNYVFRGSRGPGYERYSMRLDRAYDIGVAPEEVESEVAEQAARFLSEYRVVMDAGHEAFARGEYHQAARYFLLATELNQGDPSSRLAAAHAQVALGQYEAATHGLRRALELQSKLAYFFIDIRGAYGPADDFLDHVAGLRRAAEESGDPDLWLLLGYYLHNSGEPVLAAEALQAAGELDPDDRVIRRFGRAVSGVAPAGRR